MPLATLITPFQHALLTMLPSQRRLSWPPWATSTLSYMPKPSLVWERPDLGLGVTAASRHSTPPPTTLFFYAGGPAKKARATPAGHKHSSRPNVASEICRNFYRGRCHSPNCPRKHVCLSCGQSLQCPTRRSSPRK